VAGEVVQTTSLPPSFLCSTSVSSVSIPTVDTICFTAAVAEDATAVGNPTRPTLLRCFICLLKLLQANKLLRSSCIAAAVGKGFVHIWLAPAALYFTKSSGSHQLLQAMMTDSYICNCSKKQTKNNKNGNSNCYSIKFKQNLAGTLIYALISIRSMHGFDWLYFEAHYNHLGISPALVSGTLVVCIT
jgi:hypothetical protein